MLRRDKKPNKISASNRINLILNTIERDSIYRTHPLILLSHGSGGDYKNHQWLINTLVSNDYIVAAISHPFNSTQDNTDKGIISVWDRPVDISLLLDHLLDDHDLSVLIDKNRIGAAGFSSGGYTVLALPPVSG